MRSEGEWEARGGEGKEVGTVGRERREGEGEGEVYASTVLSCVLI